MTKLKRWRKPTAYKSYILVTFRLLEEYTRVEYYAQEILTNAEFTTLINRAASTTALKNYVKITKIYTKQELILTTTKLLNCIEKIPISIRQKKFLEENNLLYTNCDLFTN